MVHVFLMYPIRLISSHPIRLTTSSYLVVLLQMLDVVPLCPNSNKQDLAPRECCMGFYGGNPTINHSFEGLETLQQAWHSRKFSRATKINVDYSNSYEIWSGSIGDGIDIMGKCSNTSVAHNGLGP